MNWRLFSTKLLIISLFLGACQRGSDTLFKPLSPRETGIHFSNRIYEDDTINILENEYIYNGGGIGVADFNKDGLQDLYFTGNMVANHLYLNLGGLKFKEIGEEAGVQAIDRWTSGVAIVDINADGWPDIYVCATNRPQAVKRKNLLFIHQGLDEQGIPSFKDEAEAYGLADTAHNTMAAFFDYDNDGDLDLFTCINEMDEENTPNRYRSKIVDGSSKRTDKLFRNDFDAGKGHVVFTDVSKEAGILIEGFSLGINIADINEDGWKDIFVSNDYLTNDLLYINNQDGSFTDKAEEYFKHTSFSSMGNDIVDVNNDGHLDIIVVDMLPEDNFRRKTMLQPNSYLSYRRNDYYGYQFQYVRNTLQLGQGRDPHSGQPLFSDLSMYAGISATDWSWAPLVADFDNDGDRDMIITNGFPRDIIDQDFIEYLTQNQRYANKSLLIKMMPSVKIPNYAYRNNGELSFEKVSKEWGMDIPSFSNGGIYADLDNDGDLEVLVNNINDSAFVFENRLNDQKGQTNNWLRIKLQGPASQPDGFGTSVSLSLPDGSIQSMEYSPYRAYLSSMEPYLHFGLDSLQKVSEIQLRWSDGKEQLLQDIAPNQLLIIDYQQASDPGPSKSDDQDPLLYASMNTGLDSIHQEEDFVDFNIQRLLPHKLSQYGPGIAVGDLNGDQLDDIYMSGPALGKGQCYIQQKNGQFKTAELFPQVSEEALKKEELGVLIFDVENDGDNDLFIVGGGYEYPPNDSNYQDQLWLNEAGKFSKADQAIPFNTFSGSKVTAADYDKDGDIDLFITGRVIPHKYPKAASSLLLRNDSQEGKVLFTETEQSVLSDIGLISDALWTDFNGDGWVDLLLAGEWMPLTFLKNDQGSLVNVTASSGLSDQFGWWTSLVAGDFDMDGDMDYVAGNLGRNTLCKADDQHPLGIYAADFDNNGGFDAIPTIYFPNQEGEKEEFPFFGRNDMIKQVLSFRQNFPYHKDFAAASLKTIMPDSMLANALELRANYMQSSLIENKGDGSFDLKPLAWQAQWAPLYGMLVEDINEDGIPDLIMIGNDYGTEVSMGRYDAFNGLVMTGNGDLSFNILSPAESGLVVQGDAKSLVKIAGAQGGLHFLAGQNRGPAVLFKPSALGQWYAFNNDEFAVTVYLKDGRSYRQEFPLGTGFLSQSSQGIWVGKEMEKLEIVNYKGEKRMFPLP